jgi:cyanophycinase
MRRHSREDFFCAVLAAVFATSAGYAIRSSASESPAAAAAPAAVVPLARGNYRDRNFDYFVAGDPGLPRAPHTEFTLALMGGGGIVDAAYAAISGHARGGHIVILRAVSDDSFDPQDGDLGKTFMTAWGPIASAQTIVFHNREAAFDPRVSAALRGADGIFLAGGDQGNYIRYWKGTPVQDALNAHVLASRPIGGSSAGLAILGHYSYTCLDGESMESKTALADPYHAGITLESDFLHLRWLESVITDTHFSARSRLGRLIVFVARINQDHPAERVFGIGIDEKTALLVGADGVGRIAEGSAGSAWVVTPRQAAAVLVEGQPLTMKDIRIVRLDRAGSINLRSREIIHPSADVSDSIEHGTPGQDALTSPRMMRSVVPPDEG